MNPFSDVLMQHPQHSPLLHPERYVNRFALCAMFLATLEPWVEAGIVQLVQNPAYFDFSLMNSLAEQSKLRLRSHPGTAQKELGDLAVFSGMIDQCLSVPAQQREHILNLMGASSEQKAKVLGEVNRALEQDPVRQTMPFFVPENEIAYSGVGATYEHATLIASNYGASIFTNNEPCGYQLRLEASELKTPFQKVAQAISKSKLDFLNNVTADFAIGLRKDGRLADFRAYLASFANGAAVGLPSTITEKEIAERLDFEYAKYRAEWSDIQKKLARNASFAGALGIMAVVTGVMPIVGLLAPATAGGNFLINTVSKRKNLERRPLGILLELERR